MRRYLPLILSLMLFGCVNATSGTDFDIKKIDQITKGMTRNEVVKIIGIKPSHETVSFVVGKKSTLLQWIFVSISPTQSTTKGLGVSFDENNRVVYWSKSTQK